MKKFGMIKLDSEFGKRIGFTSDKFAGWLWLMDKTIIISFIVSVQEGKGNLSKLFSTLGGLGYTIEIPTPSARMMSIAKTKGFKQRFVYDETMKDSVEIWTNAN